MDKKDKRKEPEPQPEPEVIPPHYALKDFSLAVNGRLSSYKKGDIIKDQQTLYLCKKHSMPISLFDECQTAKCPNPKCGWVFAWDGGTKKGA